MNFRLSTIASAANIVVMSNGCIVEQGSHNELLEKQSTYYELVEKQRISTERSIAISEAKAALSGESDISKMKEDYIEFDKHPHDAESITTPEEWDEETESEIAEHQYSIWDLIKFVTRLNRQEMLIMISGLAWSIIAGAGNPT